MNLEKELEKEARYMGATYFGIADLRLTRGGATTPYEAVLVSEYPFAISVGVTLISSIVDRIGNQADVAALYNYRFHTHQVVNPLIDQITRRLSSIIISKRHSAIPVPAAQAVNTENSYGFFSHKMAASLSGLGWIGKSCLLITPDHGPRVRWGTILTDAPLETGTPMEVRCGRCTKCVEVCPSQAFTGKDFAPSEPREIRMLVNRHIQLRKEREQNIGTGICGMCVYICPFGKMQGDKK
ncbi:4Fe-4S double cluster binding domain-containing protein [Chloroflexota bacterium]